MIRIIGDSHAIGFERLAKDRDDFAVTVLGNGTVVTRLIAGEGVSPEFETVFAGDNIKALLLGNELYSAFYLRFDASEDAFCDFDVASPDRVLRPVTLLPESLVAATLDRLMAPIRTLCGITKISCLISGPPPTEDHGRIHTAFEKKGIHEVWTSTPEARLMAWNIQQKCFRRLAEEASIGFIPMPQEVFDTAGFLKPAFHHDGVHGNRAFHEYVLPYILQQATAFGQF